MRAPSVVARSRGREWRSMLAIAAPLILAELGWMAMGVEDTMFVGRVSAEAIGAVSVGTTTFHMFAILASGVLLGLDTLVSQSFGAGDLKDCRRWLADGIWLALFLIPPTMIAIWVCTPLLAVFGINAGVLATTKPYLWALNWSAIPLMLFFALRRYLQAIHAVRPVFLTLISANFVNIAGNWILVFGHLGAPRLGAEGSGWATCISRVYMLAGLALALVLRDPRAFGDSIKPDFTRIRRLLALGVPASAQIGFEWGVYTVATMLIATLSADVLAAHQIVLTTVSTTYMMPLGISSAAAVRVGHALGRGDPNGAAQSGWTAVGLGSIAMSCAAFTLLVFPNSVARFFTPDANVIAAAAPILRIAAFFQLFDGFQVVTTGALRGVGDTRTPMVCHFLGYWMAGLPLGYALGFAFNKGALGVWAGLAAALIGIGSVLLAQWHRTARSLTEAAA